MEVDHRSARQSPRLRIGIDVGGTFTDINLFDDESGRLAVHKVPSPPRDPSQAIADGAMLALRENGVAVDDVSYFAHGSTVATNALLQQRGCKVGLITTAGFRDLLEIGRQTRPHLYDLQVDKPPVLVSRDLRLEVRERVAADGRVLEPLIVEDVRVAIETFKRAGVEAVAICYLHGYRNPVHEQHTRSLVEQALPNVYVSVAHEILPEFREFERLNTTVVNAYLGPLVSRYVGNLARRLDELGLRCRPYMTQSNGGVVSLEVAARNTFRTVLSGPSSGVVGACYVGRHADVGNLITLDMGGTSADVSLISNGDFTVTTQREVGGYPVKTPMIDVHTIGAGGGSIGWVDAGGLLKVGPRSAGADPGPACYGRGGDEPTVTDANVVLGVLNPEYLLAGTVPIEKRRSEEAIGRLADRLGLDPMTTAEGIVDVAVANMVRAVRVISVQRGYDPRDYHLVPFGGAGPLHAGRLMRELRIRRMLIPARPGLLCAFGLLVTDVRADFLRTRIMPTSDPNLAEVEQVYDDLERQATTWLADEGFAPSDRLLRRTVDMRYLRQNYELSVNVPSGPFTDNSLERVLDEFYRVHEQAYGYAAPGEPAELVTFRVEAIGVMRKAELPEGPSGGSCPAPEATIGRRTLYLAGEHLPTPVYSRDLLAPANVVEGPAIVEQLDTTTLLLPGQRGTVDRFLNILVTDEVSA